MYLFLLVLSPLYLLVVNILYHAPLTARRTMRHSYAIMSIAPIPMLLIGLLTLRFLISKAYTLFTPLFMIFYALTVFFPTLIYVYSNAISRTEATARSVELPYQANIVSACIVEWMFATGALLIAQPFFSFTEYFLFPFIRLITVTSVAFYPHFLHVRSWFYWYISLQSLLGYAAILLGLYAYLTLASVIILALVVLHGRLLYVMCVHTRSTAHRREHTPNAHSDNRDTLQPRVSP